jgi:type VI secretion system protein ImpA
MPSPEVLDVESLLSPVAGENPAGESLQYAGVHDQIREARRQEDPLSQGDWQRELKAADWDEVIRLASDALGSRSKDLQICAWLAEAEVRKNGFPGLRDGLKLARGLHERFWDQLYPEIDAGDLEARANSLAFLDRQCAEALKLVAITKSSNGNFSYLDFEQAKLLDPPANVNLDSDAQERLNRERARAAEEGRVTSDLFQKSRNATRRAFYEETYASLNESWEEFQQLDHVMDEKFGRQTPGLSALKKSLDTVRTWVEKTVKEKRIEEPDASDAVEGEAGADGEGGAAASPGGAIRARQDALRRLAEVADYFRRTEPHSPVSYLVQRAIAWGHMPLEAWLGDVIKDSSLLENLRETLGLKPGGQSE